jgi:membrane protein
MTPKRLSKDFVLKLFKEAISEFSKDNILRLSAALSYYSIFSIAPLLLVAIGVIGWIYRGDAANGVIEKQLAAYIGAVAAKAVQSIVVDAGKSSGGATIIGFGTLLFGASTVFLQLKAALDTIWEVRPKPGSSVKTFISEQLLSFGMVLVVGFLLLISLLLTTTIAALGDWMQRHLGIPSSLSSFVGSFAPLVVEVVLFALIFKVLPSAEIKWESVWFGASFTAVLFEIGKYGLSIYLTKAAPGSAFGAAGSVVLVLLWVYYASTILFFGAVMTEVFARLSGHAIQPAINAETTDLTCGPGLTPVSASTLKTGAQPARESLLPILRQAQVKAPQRPGPRIPPRTLAERAQRELEELHAHPFAEVGAALGLGLAAGLLSRLWPRTAPAPTPREHLALGAQGMAEEGIATWRRAIRSIPAKYRSW